jgi:hypothetical protein
MELAHRPGLVCLLSALFGLLPACGGRVVVDAMGQGGVGGKSGGTGGSAAATTGGAGGESPDGGAMCNTPPPPSPTVPDLPGCYTNVMNGGWVAIPCDCELWLANTTYAPITAAIQLTVTPPDEVPTLTGMLDVEVAFDDPDGSAYATWSNQAGNGVAFTVTNAGGTTTVRMGESSVVLAPVPVVACTTSKARASVSGSFSAKLHLHAALDEGSFSATADGTCSAIPPT